MLLNFQNEIPKSNIVLGSNLEIPFEDNCFDLIVSINTIHYSIGEEIDNTFKLWKKKLKENGRIFVETAGPRHESVLDAKKYQRINGLGEKMLALEKVP